MHSQSDKIQVSLKGLFSAYGKARRIANIDVCKRVKAIKQNDVDACKDEISNMLNTYYEDTPEAHLLWGEKLLENDDKKDGFSFICSALVNARYDKKPALIVSTAIKIMNKNGLGDYADVASRVAVKHFSDNAVLATQRIHKMINGSAAATVELLEAERRNHPDNAVMVNTLGNAYITADRPGDAIALLEAERRNHPDNAVMVNTLGNAYITADRPGDAIALLEAERRNHPEDAVMVNTLGNAYITADRPGDAIALLEAERRNHPDNVVMVTTLGNAYVNTRNRQKFEWIADQINIPELRDYLEAKLYYFENSGQKAMRLLEPHIQNIDTCPTNIFGLYMACIPDEHGLHAILPTLHGDGFYQHLLKCRDEWRENPMRMELSSKGFAHAQTFYELGGNPISSADRKKAGMGTEAPVHMRGTCEPYYI